MERLLISKLPPVAGLEVFSGEIQPQEPAAPAVVSKCRELARFSPQLLVSPAGSGDMGSSASKHRIWIVCKVGFISEPITQQKLTHLGIKLCNKGAVSFSLLQACYQFTLIARLAPKWNSISKWLVRGSDVFVTGRGQALSMEVGVTSTELTLSLTAYKLTFNLLKPHDLEVTNSLLKQFQSDSEAVISETAITSNQCFVLPKFSSAHVYSALHHLPVSPEFDSYDKIRLHWKKQYGLIVPEKQDLFYQVFFRFKPKNFLTYPGCCVAKTMPVAIPSKDTDNIVMSFISDVHSRMPYLCGSSIKFIDKPLIPHAVLLPSNAINHLPNARPVPVKPTIQKLLSTVASCSAGSQQLVPMHQSSSSYPPSATVQVVPSLSTGLTVDSICVSSGTVVPVFQHTTPQAQCVPTNKTMRKRSSVCRAEGMPCSKQPTVEQLEIPPAQVPNRQKEPALLAHRRQMCMAQTVPNEDIDDDFMYTEALSLHTSQQKRTAVAKGVKPRSSSIELEGVSEQIVRKLQKTTAPALKKWLQDNQVKYRSKDKKNDLIRLAAEHIKATGTTLNI